MVKKDFRSLVLGVAATTFLIFCFSFVIKHQRYLNQSQKPSKDEISQEVLKLADAFPGLRSSEVKLFEKPSFLLTATVRMSADRNINPTQQGQQKLQDDGWRSVVVSGAKSLYFCKKDMVAEVGPANIDGSYSIVVSWGRADAECH